MPGNGYALPGLRNRPTQAGQAHESPGVFTPPLYRQC